MKLTVAALQSNLQWENPKANLDHFSRLLEGAKPADIYVFPEMFTTGFTMNVILAEEFASSSTIAWMREKAREKNAAIVGSIVVKDQSKFYNRMIFSTPDGVLLYYDKRHLFRMAKEHDSYAQGNSRCVVYWKGFSILLQVCYDLRFPVWSRNTVDETQNFLYDGILYVANWPSPRVNAWSTLLRARAIENLSYVVGVNRVGEDAKGNDYSGGTACIDFAGTTQSEATDNCEEIIYATWDKVALTQFRAKFPVWMDADSFSLDI